MKILQIFVILIFLGISNGYSHSKNSQTIEKFFNASGISLVDVQFSAGNLTVIGEDRSDISLKVEKIVRHAKESQLEEIFEETEPKIAIRKNELYIFFDYKGGNGGRKFIFFGPRKPSINLNLEIRAPKKIAQRLKLSAGNITLQNITGPVQVRLIAGNISAKFPQGISNDMALRASVGTITALLPSDEAFHFVAKTRIGDIETNFPIGVKGKFITKRVTGDINGGGSELRLDTSVGSIDVKRL